MLPVLPITLGASTLGTRSSGPAAAALADAMLASPLGHVDTSNIYGAGRSEAELGAAIARAGGPAADPVVYSKADRDPVTGAFDGERVRRSLDESLTRLGLDRLPIYHLHDPQNTPFARTMGSGVAVESLLALRDEGVIGAVGIAAGPRDLVLRYVETGAFDAVLTHNRFTLADRSAAPILEAARERGMTVFNAAPFGGGTLANPAKRTYGYRPVPEALATWLAALRRIAGELDVDLAAAALQFSLRDPRIDSTVIGISTLERLEQLSELADTTVRDEFWTALAALGGPPASAND